MTALGNRIKKILDYDDQIKGRIRPMVLHEVEEVEANRWYFVTPKYKVLQFPVMFVRVYQYDSGGPMFLDPISGLTRSVKSALESARFFGPVDTDVLADQTEGGEKSDGR